MKKRCRKVRPVQWVLKSITRCAWFLWLFILSAPLSAQVEPLKLGLDVLLEKRLDLIKGKRLALLSNRTGIDSKGAFGYSSLVKHNLRIVFTPEHGLMAAEEAGKPVESAMNADSVRVISLYGKIKKPTKEMLDSIDAIVFDIQDIGTRCYTYISTMKLAMQAAAEFKKEFIVLDRPNPLAPIEPQGFMLDEKFRSFVGELFVPFIHALTVGELATFIQAEELPALKLTVVKMENYARDRFGDGQVQLLNLFVPPSPNITSIDAEILYPATVLLEGTNLSEGRGTETPFEVFGAPFIYTEDLLYALRRHRLEGVSFEAAPFTPQSIEGKSSSPKYEGAACNGVRLRITDRRKIKPFEIAVAILVSMRKLYPKDFRWLKGKFIDKLAGTDKLRQMIDAGNSKDEILSAARESTAAFFEKRKKYLLYTDATAE